MASSSSPTPGPDRGKRERILDAAYQVCASRGVDGARMEEVASLARVSKGTLYRFFESKEQLLLATILDSYEQFLPLFDAGTDPRADAGQRLGALLHGMTEILAAVAPRMNVHYQAWGLVAKQPELKRRLYDFLRGFHAERAQTLERTVREGQRAGLFRADADVEGFAEGIQALLSGFLYRATFDPERATPALLRRSFDGLVRNALLVEAPEKAGGGG